MNRPNFDLSVTPDQRYLSTAQVARALGVSVTTVKRWVDDDILPAHRTAGGHRKLLLLDVMRLVRDGNLPQVDVTNLLPKVGAAASDSAAVRSQLIATIVAGDAGLIRTLVLAASQTGMRVEVLADEVIAPVMRYVGDEWASGRMTVMEEHRVSQECVAALYELRAVLMANAEPNRPVAVGGAPEEDHSILPSLLAQLTLLDSGWEAINLGPHTPMSAFTAALDELRPALVWVSVSHLKDAAGFEAEYKRFFAAADAMGVAVAVGGGGLTAKVRASLPYTAFGDGFTQLSSFAKSLYRRPTRPKRGRPLKAKVPSDEADTATTGG